MLKSQKGITLVALVVTIVVLIILATISISVVMNGNIIGRAESAEQWQLNAEAEFAGQDANFAAYVDEKINAIYATDANSTNP